jgi:hypothetical protein
MARAAGSYKERPSCLKKRKKEAAVHPAATAVAHALN